MFRCFRDDHTVKSEQYVVGKLIRGQNMYDIGSNGGSDALGVGGYDQIHTVMLVC